MDGYILIVENELDIADVMRRYLEFEGFAVVCASGGEEGLQLARGAGGVDAFEPFRVLGPGDAAVTDGGVEDGRRVVAVDVGDAQLDLAHARQHMTSR